MIVRIMGEGQYSVPDEVLASLNEVDDRVEQAVRAGDQQALTTALEELLAAIRSGGSPVPDDVLADSELILPDASALLEEVRTWLADAPGYDGLIPG